jgi:hypothetical protein
MSFISDDGTPSTERKDIRCHIQLSKSARTIWGHQVVGKAAAAETVAGSMAVADKFSDIALNLADI